MNEIEPNGSVVSVVDIQHRSINPRPTLMDYAFGRRLASDEEEHQKVGPLTGVPIFGLDALSSAAYGPEAALRRWLWLSSLSSRRVLGSQS